MMIGVSQIALEPVTDVTVGGWIAPRLGPFGGWVGSVAPRGYAAYARVLHPVPDAHDRPARWAQVCAATGRRPHALMQWHAIAGVIETQVETRSGTALTKTMLWPGAEPEVGNLEPDALRTLCGVLAGHTAPGQDCFFALWEGRGWIHGSPSVAVANLDGSSEPVPPAFPPEVIDGPRLRHPGRNYLLFTGPLSAALDLGDPRGVWLQSPNLFWSAERSWCVATEIDFDSTIVAGSSELIAAVLAEPRLEAWPVDPDDSLAYDGDTVNT
jgi:hypothetical protein